ncbi:hypothetical protein Leryth_005828 [Lithospermum erythrorhizon]|nr:hypothetical protein Leryth_005828 [Lithospermum erythrorhizon]
MALLLQEGYHIISHSDCEKTQIKFQLLLQSTYLIVTIEYVCVHQSSKYYCCDEIGA